MQTFRLRAAGGRGVSAFPLHPLLRHRPHSRAEGAGADVAPPGPRVPVAVRPRGPRAPRARGDWRRRCAARWHDASRVVPILRPAA